jgi:hypothetical protein
MAPLRWRWTSAAAAGADRVEPWGRALADLAEWVASGDGAGAWPVAPGRWMIFDHDIVLVVEFDGETPAVVTVHPILLDRDELVA